MTWHRPEGGLDRPMGDCVDFLSAPSPDRDNILFQLSPIVRERGHS